MRHKRVQSSKRHKKLKTIEGPSTFNRVKDTVLAKTKEQGIPRKMVEMMRLKTEILESQKKKVNKKNKFLQKSEPIKNEVEIERGMTRIPKVLPDKIEKSQFESTTSFMNRLNKMVSKAMNEANIEDHFDIDLGGKVPKKNKNQQKDDDGDDPMDSLPKGKLPKNPKKLEELMKQQAERRKLKNLKKKERKMKKNKKNRVEDDSDQEEKALFCKEKIAFGEVVHNPPDIKWKKREPKKIANL